MTRLSPPAQDDVADLEQRLLTRAAWVKTVQVNGRITHIRGTVIQAALPEGRIGEEVMLRDPITRATMVAEIIGFEGDEAVLAPAGNIRGLSSRAEVIGTGQHAMAPAGAAVIGRVVDAFGGPMDGGPSVPLTQPLDVDPPPALERPVIATPFESSLRAIDGMLTMGLGQRIGLFGAAGVGKSTLLSQIIRGAKVDAIILGLIGERGREVVEFLTRDLGEEGRKQAGVIVATSDRPATERLRAAYAATAAAEALRAQGKNVLLLIDSATRVARAMREIGLAAGEPPVRRGFPPSTFALLPRLVERPGLYQGGSITAIYTVLVEGDDDTADPVADELRSLLDGHVILSRSLANAGHFPAIDVQSSKSRVMAAVTNAAHQAAARQLGRWMSKLQDIELLLQVGEYKKGGDLEADAAIAARDSIDEFLRQGTNDYDTLEGAQAKLLSLAGER